MARHGVYVAEAATSVATPAKAASGIPFVLGLAPLHTVDAADRAEALTPVLATSFEEAAAALGYSEDWSDYGLSEFMHYHFKLAGQQPVIFLPLTETVSTQSFSGDGTAKTFAITAKPDNVLSVTVGTTPAQITGYDATTGVVTLKDAPASGTDNVTASYVTRPTASAAAAAVEKIDLCMTMFGLVPDLICAPGFSQESAVAAAMAAKAGAVNGIFKARALVDIPGTTYTAAISAKQGGSYDEASVCCWPCGTLGGLVFHGSTVMAGRMAQTDTDNGGVPVETPSNKAVSLDGICLPDGAEVVLTLAQANTLNAAGINTFLNFMGSFVAWGNYTGAYPGSSDVKDYLLPIARMFDWVGNSLIRTFWSKLDDPMNRRLIDTILDSANIWLNGLTGRGFLLGGRVEMLDAENPLTDLMAGIIHLHLYLTPPSPAQEIDFALEYDASYASAAFSA